MSAGVGRIAEALLARRGVAIRRDGASLFKERVAARYPMRRYAPTAVWSRHRLAFLARTPVEFKLWFVIRSALGANLLRTYIPG